MTKKGYVEGSMTFNVTLDVEIPIGFGDVRIIVHRIGEPINVVPDRWAEE